MSTDPVPLLPLPLFRFIPSGSVEPLADPFGRDSLLLFKRAFRVFNHSQLFPQDQHYLNPAASLASERCSASAV